MQPIRMISRHDEKEMVVVLIYEWYSNPAHII